MEPDSDRKEEGRQEKPEDAPEAGNRLLISLKRFWRAMGGQLLRLKHFLQAGMVRMIDACSGLLLRLRKRAAEPKDEETQNDERRSARENHPEKSAVRVEHAKEVTPEEVAVHEPRSPLRSFFVYLLVLVIGAIAGMTFSFTLLSTMLINQAQRIEDQSDEITQLEKQHSRIQESEAKCRKENTEYQKRVSEFEANLTPQNAAGDPAIAEPAGSSAPHATGKPPQARKTDNCNLDAGNIGGNLTRCIDDFNRK